MLDQKLVSEMTGLEFLQLINEGLAGHACRLHKIDHGEAIEALEIIRKNGNGDFQKGLENTREVHKKFARINRATDKISIVILSLVAVAITSKVLLWIWEGVQRAIKVGG